MATAPFQLWIDLPSVTSATRTSSTVTVTTSAAHGLTSGTFVQLEGFTGTAGTSMVGVYSATVTSGTTFTVSSAGSAGTATSGSAVVSRDLFSPLIDFASASRQAAAYAIPETLSMSAAGDGNSNSFGFQVAQDDTPSDGPWWTNTPDQARIRLYKVATGTTPTDADLYFIGTLAAISATMNPSGQGSVADVTVDEINAVLDRVVIQGRSTISPAVPTDSGGFVRASNVVTVTTQIDHNFAIGQQVQIAGVIGGGSSMNGTFSVATIPTTKSFTYASTGTAGTGDTALTPTAGSFIAGSKQTVELTFAVDHNLSAGSTVLLRGFICSTTKFQNLLNASFTGTQNVQTGSTSKKLLVKLAAPLDSVQTITTRGTVQGDATIIPVGGQTNNTWTIVGGVSEDTAVQNALAYIDRAKKENAPLQRLFNTSVTTNITGAGTNSANTIGFSVPAGTLRSILDAIIEAFVGEDSKTRRYYIGLDRTLYYKLVDSASRPTYATAPYKIIVTGAQNPNTTTAAATVYPFDISVAYDHNTVKNALFNISSGSSRASSIQSYLGAGYTERAGAPVFDSVIDYPTSATNGSAAIIRAAKSYFLEGSVPMQTINFTLRGAGTAAHNVDGFSAGYYQTGASTFALQKRWEPGQWVDITCAELGLSGLYRIEQVDWSLMSGSFFQEIRITANRRTPNNLVDIVKRRR